MTNLTKLPNQKLDVKLIALDLDDTLLTKDLTISTKTLNALTECAKRGIYIVLCSGRAESGILPYNKLLNLYNTEQGKYIIAINGSSIYDVQKKENIFTKKIPGETLVSIYKEALKRGFSCQVYNYDTTFANVDNEFTRIDAKLCNLKIEIVKDFEEFLLEGHTKMLIPGKENEVAEFTEFLKKKMAGKAEVFTSKPFFLEVMPYAWGKGQAILHLAKMLGLEKSQTMAFGDSMNDESMLTCVESSPTRCAA